MTASSPAASEKVPLITKLAFGAGDVGPAVVTSVLSFYLAFFLSDVAGLPIELAGWVLLLTKIWDSVNDPIVGALSDRVRTRWGRRRPWFLFGAVPFGLTFLLLFLVPPLGVEGKFVYYLVVALMLDTAFTVVNVPYTALTPELTRDYHERTSLNAYRFGFSIVSGLLAAVLFDPIVKSVEPALGESGAYGVAAAVWAVVATLPFFFAFWGTYERHDAAAEPEELPFLDGPRIVFANRAFRYATTIYLLSWLVLQTVATVLKYYTTYWLRQEDIFPLMILGVQGSATVWLFIWSAVSRRIGKQRVYIYGMSVWIVVAFVLFAVQPDWPTAVIIALGALVGMGVAVAYLVPWSLLPDVIELDELETGRRREGIFYGFFVLLQKFGLALGLFAVTQVLGLAGYIEPVAGGPAPVQPDSALLAMRLLVGPGPVVFLLAGMLLVARFPITQADHERNLARLAEGRTAA